MSRLTTGYGTTETCHQFSAGFHVTPDTKPHDLEDLFRYEVFKMLNAEGKITDAVIENMLSWHHSGFNVYCGSAIWPHDESALENLAHYVIRAAFSQERMNYITDDQSPYSRMIILALTRRNAARTQH